MAGPLEPLPAGLAQPALHLVTHHRSADLRRHRQADADMGELVCQAVDRQQASIAPAAGGIHAAKIRRLLETMPILHLSAPPVRRNLRNQLPAGWRQLLPALAAPRFDDLRSPGRAHPLQKTVNAPAVTLLGLK